MLQDDLQCVQPWEDIDSDGKCLRVLHPNLECGLKWFPTAMHFGSDMGYNTRKVIPGTEGHRWSNSWSVMLSRKDLDQKGEMWDWKEGTSLEIHLGGLSHPINSSPIAEPDRGTLVSNRKSLFSYPRRRKIFSSLATAQSTENRHHPEFSFFQCTFIQKSPFQLPPFSSIMFLSFVFWICLWFCHSLLVPNCHSQINPLCW